MPRPKRNACSKRRGQCSAANCRSAGWSERERHESLPAGARPCIGVLAHGEILAQADGLAINTAEDGGEAMVVVFDAQCLLCSRWVRFLLARRRGGHIRFASIQGETGRRLLAEQGLQADNLQTLLVIHRGKVWQETAAILRVLHTLGWPWRLAWVGWLVPAPLRDAAYRWAARNRYRVSGRSESCMLPAPEQAGRFLD